MTPFFAGALGALAVLVTLAVVRVAVWRLHFGRLHGRRLPLRFLFRRLGTRPEQERVISHEAEALASELHALRADLRSVRDEVADLLVAPTLDPVQRATLAELIRRGPHRHGRCAHGHA